MLFSSFTAEGFEFEPLLVLEFGFFGAGGVGEAGVGHYFGSLGGTIQGDGLEETDVYFALMGDTEEGIGL